MNVSRKISDSIVEYKVKTGLKPNAIVLSEFIFMKLIAEWKGFLVKDMKCRNGNRFQNIEVLVSRDIVNHVTII